jgi:hypothetical protein
MPGEVGNRGGGNKKQDFLFAPFKSDSFDFPTAFLETRAD